MREDFNKSLEIIAFLESNIRATKQAICYLNQLLSDAQDDIIRENKDEKEIKKKTEKFQKGNLFKNIEKLEGSLLKLLSGLEAYRNLKH